MMSGSSNLESSIEHFQPQNPVEGESWEADDLDGFGNLALITVSGNSSFLIYHQREKPPHIQVL